jgi:hypothetical protein
MWLLAAKGSPPPATTAGRERHPRRRAEVQRRPAPEAPPGERQHRRRLPGPRGVLHRHHRPEGDVRRRPPALRQRADDVATPRRPPPHRRPDRLPGRRRGRGRHGEHGSSWDQVRLTAKDWMVLTRMTNQLNADSVINWPTSSRTRSPTPTRSRKTRRGFTGTATSTYGGITGVVHGPDEQVDGPASPAPRRHQARHQHHLGERWSWPTSTTRSARCRSTRTRPTPCGSCTARSTTRSSRS